MKTLIVDDVQANCRVLRGLLTPFGPCETAATGREAIDAFQSAWKAGSPFQLVCLDIMLPDFDGLQILEVIRKMEEAMKIEERQRAVVVMITAAGDIGFQVRARDLQCDGYLQKPIFRKDLIATLKRANLIADKPMPPVADTHMHPPQKPPTP